MLDALKSPITIRNLQVRNRIVMPPMTTRLASASGAVSKQLINYYAERSKGGAGLLIVENALIRPEPLPGMVNIHSESFIPGLNELAESIKGWGAKAAIQVNNWGILTKTADPNLLTSDQVIGFVEDYASAALRAQKAGFDLVEIHAAHAFLIAQFLSPCINRRSDDWGGTWEKRANFLLSIIRRTREKVGHEFLLSLRISGDEFMEGGRTLEETEQMIPLIEKAGTDLADRGKKVWVIEAFDQIASRAESNVRNLLVQRLAQKKVVMYPRSQVEQVKGKQVTIKGPEGETLQLEADFPVGPGGSLPAPIALEQIGKRMPPPEVYIIGDCRQPGRIFQAIHDGNRTGWII